MPRPPSISADMIGLRGAGRSTALNRIVKSDDPPIGPGLRYTAFGLVLEYARHTPPVAQAFEGVAYLRKLAGHRRRIRRGEADLQASIAPYYQGPTVMTRTPPKPILPGGRDWESLRVVNCTRCQKVLLAAAEEALRSLCRTRTVARLPPPIAGRTADGYALCAECVPLAGIRQEVA